MAYDYIPYNYEPRDYEPLDDVDYEPCESDYALGYAAGIEDMDDLNAVEDATFYDEITVTIRGAAGSRVKVVLG